MQKASAPIESVDQQTAFNALCCYTLTLNDEAFIHQHVVDAFAAQFWQPDQRPIKLCFALIGLMLAIEQGFTGKQVQQLHVKIAANKRRWPDFIVPEFRGALTAVDVCRRPPGAERNKAIMNWCCHVWDTFAPNRERLCKLLSDYGYTFVPENGTNNAMHPSRGSAAS